MAQQPIDADAFNAFERSGWEAKAGGYGDFFGTITARLVEPLLDAAHIGEGIRVLDVGTGPGYAAGRADDRGAAVLGVDVAEPMIESARRIHPQLEFRQGDAEELPLEAASFDAVIANFLLLHLGRPEAAVAEFTRVLAPGGRLALTVWDLPDRARFLGVFLDAVAAVGAAPPEGIPAGPPFFRFSEDREFARLLRDQELEEIDVASISFTHPVSSPDELWRGLLGGTVRTSALILGQTAEVRTQIRAAFDRIVAEYNGPAGLEIPVSVKLGSGRKASTSA